MTKKLMKKGGIQRGFQPEHKEEIAEVKESEGTILDVVEKELAKDGIIPFDNANVLDDYLKLPSDITEVHSRDLGRFFNTFTQQKVWVRTNLSRVVILSKELESDLDNIRQNVYAELPVKMSVKEKELQLRDKAEDLIHQINIVNSKKIMLSDYLDSLIDILFVISREVTRRSDDFKDDSRENSIERKGGR